MTVIGVMRYRWTNISIAVWCTLDVNVLLLFHLGVSFRVTSENAIKL